MTIAKSYDRIVIRDFAIDARIGIHAHEQINAQPLLIQCELQLKNGARQSKDDIADTVDYAALRQNVIDMLQARPYQLLESAAEDIARLCLADKRVQNAKVKIEKLKIFNDCVVGVEILRSADD